MERYRALAEAVNRHVDTFNLCLAPGRQLGHVDLKCSETSAWIEDSSWGGVTWPSKDSYGVYFLLGHHQNDPARLGLYIGKASLKRIGFRVWSHLKPGKDIGRYTKTGPDGSNYCIQMLFAVPMPYDDMRSFASALEEHLITALRSELYLLNRVGNK